MVWLWLALHVLLIPLIMDLEQATGAPPARVPQPDKTTLKTACRRCRRRVIFFKIKVRPRSCRSYLIHMAPLYWTNPSTTLHFLCYFSGDPTKTCQTFPPTKRKKWNWQSCLWSLLLFSSFATFWHSLPIFWKSLKRKLTKWRRHPIY